MKKVSAFAVLLVLISVVGMLSACSRDFGKQKETLRVIPILLMKSIISF